MKNIIISNPELQTFKQRCGSLFLSFMSWMLWLYFLIPLFTLGGWFLGVKSLTDEIRWFGGYKSLLDLLVMYVAIMVVISIVWIIWSFWLSWFHKSHRGKTLPPVDESALSTSFGVELKDLRVAKQCKKVTVHFDEHAKILELEPN